MTTRGFEIALFAEPPAAWSPVGRILAGLFTDIFQGAGEMALKLGYIVSWWTCLLTALVSLLRLAARGRPWHPLSPSLGETPVQRP